ncbi:hypothetical protein MPEAHAMD_2821 [Methylobacterium frigidaeris]|uniref:Uncharacterized protein n=1 Tax=Methylobacterium frigidaeris TaxID=2038277 RepID=A0AA37M4V4_9HYPH|nr:hypothetical protein MPEAHAMD_2821 [Methylobacterium frigidaeris]
MSTNDVRCELSRHRLVQVTCLPERFARVGGDVKLKEEGGRQDGWRVATSYPGARLSHEVLMERSQDYMRTRAASDIRLLGRAVTFQRCSCRRCPRAPAAAGGG